jgi:uncharacterized membrane protein YqjE
MRRSAVLQESLVFTARRVGRRLLDIGGNRVELLRVELAEEGQRIVRAAVFALLAVFLVLLAGMTLTAGIVVAFWEYSPVLVLGGITVVYAGLAGMLLWRLKVLFTDWSVLPSSVEQLRRDAALVDGCLRQAFNEPARESPRP